MQYSIRARVNTFSWNEAWSRRSGCAMDGLGEQQAKEEQHAKAAPATWTWRPTRHLSLFQVEVVNW